jgi:hypothetical protein
MASPSTSSQPSRRFQALADLQNLKRSALHSHYRRKVDDLADDVHFPELKAFLPKNLLPWVTGYLKYLFKRKHSFQTYPSTGERGVYRLQAADGGEVVKLAIAGDWGTGTNEAYRVAAGISAFTPDYTIHLGDVYYVGDSTEVEENCLGKSEAGYEGVNWPKGQLGSFSLSGNHEMYANGNGYFDLFLPTLGIPSSKDGKQLASFFCLENDIWRILALDTGYNSLGMPILSQLPFIKKIPGIAPSCKLEAALIEWLRTVVKPKERVRSTILLTHHQYFSSFEEGYPRPAKQLMEFLAGQDLLWIWGHEHRWAVYDKHSDGSLTAYGRCLGHAGMPVEITKPRAPGAPLQYFDERIYLEDKDTKFGMNGFLNLQIAGDIVTLDHRDVTNRSVLTETFTAGTNGSIAHSFLNIDAKLSRGSAIPKAALAQAAG